MRKTYLQLSMLSVFCLFTTGIIYGYSALKPVLVQEGVFEELCDGGGNATAASAAAAAAAAAAEEDGAVVCVPQSLQLDLMFTIGALSPLIGPLNGAVLDRFGPRVTLSSGGVLLVLACVLFAFADDQTFDVYIPAYLVMGVAGQMLVQTSMMLCSLVPKRAGLFMSMFNAAFDSSAFVFVVFQAIYTSTHGDIGVKQLFLGYMAVPVLLVLLVFFLAPPLSATKKAGEQQTSLELSTAASEQIEPAESSASLQDMRAPPVSLRKQLESGQFWWPPLALMCLCIYQLRLNFYISTVDNQMRQFASPETAEQMTEVFAILVAAVGLAVILPVGWLLDTQPTSVVQGVVFAVMTLFGLVVMIPVAQLQYVSFILFSAARPLMYAAMADCVGRLFKFHNFGKLWGIIAFIAPIVSQFQYLLNYIAIDLMKGNFLVVNAIVFALTLVCVAFPIQARIYERRQQSYLQLPSLGFNLPMFADDELAADMDDDGLDRIDIEDLKE